MASKKEPIEIECAGCSSGFRLWVPTERLAEWEKGVKISCVRCGERYLVKRNDKGVVLDRVKEGGAEAVGSSGEIEAAPIEATPVAGARGTILLVDDERLAREMVDHSFSDSGYAVIICKNGTEGLNALKKQKVDLLVTDIHLKNAADPEATIDGEEFLVKASAMQKNLPSVITTGKDIIDDLVLDPKWFDLRVKGFIQKGNPFWVEELKLKIQEVLQKR